MHTECPDCTTARVSCSRGQKRHRGLSNERRRGSTGFLVPAAVTLTPAGAAHQEGVGTHGWRCIYHWLPQTDHTHPLTVKTPCCGDAAQNSALVKTYLTLYVLQISTTPYQHLRYQYLSVFTQLSWSLQRPQTALALIYTTNAHGGEITPRH